MAVLRVGNRLPTLCKTYNNLNSDIKAIVNEAIESNKDGSCLLRLLKVAEGIEEKNLNSLSALIQVALGHFQVIDSRIDAYGFIFNNNIVMNPTLEDVLCLTGLPISGEPLIPNDSRDPDAFRRVFGDEVVNKLGITGSSFPLSKLDSIANDDTLGREKRLIAVLLKIIHCIIIPSHDGHSCKCAYVQFVEDLTKVNSYAWGAALLAFLVYAMKRKKEEEKLNNIKGFTPILEAFFLYRIPKLQEKLGVQVEKSSTPTFLLSPVLSALCGVCHVKRGLDTKVQVVFDDLTNEVHYAGWSK